MLVRSVGNHLASDALPHPTTPELKNLENIADIQRNTKGLEHVTNYLPLTSTAIMGEISPPVPLQTSLDDVIFRRRIIIFITLKIALRMAKSFYM